MIKLMPDLLAQWLATELGGTWEETQPYRVFVMLGAYQTTLWLEAHCSVLSVATGLFGFRCSLADPTLVDQLQAQLAKHYHGYELVHQQPESESVERPWLNDTD